MREENCGQYFGVSIVILADPTVVLFVWAKILGCSRIISDKELRLAKERFLLAHPLRVSGGLGFYL